MGLAPPSSFLRRLLARPQVQKDQDPADMGTAFGLEASLGPVSDYPPAGSPGPDGAAPDERSPMAWLGRRPRRAG